MLDQAHRRTEIGKPGWTNLEPGILKDVIAMNRPKKLFGALLMLVFSWLLATDARAGIKYVNGDCGNDGWLRISQDCGAPDDNGSKRTIQAGMDVASDGDFVLVAPDPDWRRPLTFHTTLSGDLNGDDIADLEGFLACVSGNGEASLDITINASCTIGVRLIDIMDCNNPVELGFVGTHGSTDAVLSSRGVVAIGILPAIMSRDCHESSAGKAQKAKINHVPCQHREGLPNHQETEK